MSNFEKARRSKGWIVLLATVVGLGVGGYTYVHRAASQQLYVTNCGIVDYKPGVFFKSCSQGGMAVGQIDWESWSQDGARGKGIYAINDCKPDCKTGTLTKVPVTVVLTGDKPLTEVRGKRVLNHISIATLDKKPLPLGTSSSDSWVLE